LPIAATFDIVLHPDTDLYVEFYIEDANGDPVDLSGWTAEADIVTDYVHNSGASVFTSTKPTVTITAATGKVVISAAASLTSGITAPAAEVGRYFWDVEATHSDGTKECWARGVCLYEGEATA